MQVINNIQIPNKYTFEKLTKLFTDKKPTSKTVLLLRLYTEQNIDGSEMHILVQNQIPNKKKGNDFTTKKFNEPKANDTSLLKKIAELDVYKEMDDRLIDKLKEESA